MKIGLYFGSFNPMHIGHLHVANSVLRKAKLDLVWFVLTPLNPFKAGNDIVTYEHREEMIRHALRAFKSDYLKLCTVEKDLPTPNYTIDTLEKLKVLYPEDTFELIMGADNIHLFKNWKNYQEILKNYTINIYEREETYRKTENFCQQLYFNQNEVKGFRFIEDHVKLTIRSTYIRSDLKEGINVSYLLPKKVYKYIKKYNLYG